MDDLPREIEGRGRRTLSPHILEAEERYLGVCLTFQQPKLQAEALRLLQPEDLGEAHGLMLAAMQRVHARGDEVETFTVDAELCGSDLLEQAGGRALLIRLQDWSLISTPDLLRYYVRTIREAGDARGLWAMQDNLHDWLADTDMPLMEIRNRCARVLEAPRRASGRRGSSLAAALEEEMQRLHHREEVPTLKIGLPTLDRLGGGLEPGEVGLICGEPGSGKSVLAEMQAFYAAADWGPVGVISLEMSARRLALRALAQKTTFSFHELRQARRRDGSAFDAGDLDECGVGQVGLLPLAERIFVEHDCFQLDAIVERLSDLAAEEGIRAAVVDYGGLISAEVRKGGNRTEEQSLIARALKNQVAVPLNIPVWCLVQPNKERSRRGTESLLRVTDIDGASEWRAVANQIWLINRDPAAPPPVLGQIETSTPVLLEIAKSRDGGRGMVPLTLQGERFLFVEREMQREAPPEYVPKPLWDKTRAWERNGDE